MEYFENVEAILKELCEECKNYGTENCIKSKCYVGFALNAIKAAKDNGQQVIKEGSKLLPKDDLKFYDEDSISKGIANVCKLCKECKENHNEDCTIALTRRSLESTQLKKPVVYPGNVLLYLMNISKENPELADKIKNEYRSL